jgi:hypothetical protein
MDISGKTELTTITLIFVASVVTMETIAGKTKTRFSQLQNVASMHIKKK